MTVPFPSDLELDYWLSNEMAPYRKVAVYNIYQLRMRSHILDCKELRLTFQKKFKKNSAYRVVKTAAVNW